MLGYTESEKVRLISREIIFAEFQPTYVYVYGHDTSIHVPQRHRQTDRQLAFAIPRSAMLRAGSCGNKTVE